MAQWLCPQLMGWEALCSHLGTGSNPEGRSKTTTPSSFSLIFLFTTHSTPFIYGYIPLDHSEYERGNQLPLHGLLFFISSKELLYTLSHIHDNSTAFVVSVMERWVEREIAQLYH